MVILYFTFVGKGKSKADVPIIGGKNVGEQHTAERGKRKCFHQCEVTAGMQEVGLMWHLINLYYRPSALSTSAVVWGSGVFFPCVCAFLDQLLHRIKGDLLCRLTKS